MGESPFNIIRTCAKHSARPDPRFTKIAHKHFIGRHCKLGFPIPNAHSKEHMWVLVTEVVVENGKKWLKGTLDNDPVYIDANHGDIVVFSRDEIEA